MASRMESTGKAGCVQVSDDIYRQLRPFFNFTERGAIQVKGKGEMHTWLLDGIKTSAASNIRSNLMEPTLNARQSVEYSLQATDLVHFRESCGCMLEGQNAPVVTSQRRSVEMANTRRSVDLALGSSLYGGATGPINILHDGEQTCQNGHDSGSLGPGAFTGAFISQVCDKPRDSISLHSMSHSCKGFLHMRGCV